MSVLMNNIPIPNLEQQTHVSAFKLTENMTGNLGK